MNDIVTMNIYPDQRTALPKTVDEIRFYGISAQRKLEQLSKALSGAVLQCSPAAAEERISQSILHLCELDPSEEQNNLGRKGSLFSIFSKKSKWEQYVSLLREIDDTKLSLQMQQVQYLKEIDILDRLQIEAEKCCDDLSGIIACGSRFLQESAFDQKGQEENAEFRNRFLQRINDLRLSETIALQSKAQIILLKNNANELAEKLQNAVLNAIPLWRNQVTLVLGIDSPENGVKNSPQHSRKGKNTDSAVVDSLKKVDRQLLKVLSDIEQLFRKALEKE